MTESRPRCAILAASPKARRLVAFLVDNAGLRLEVLPLDWRAADEPQAWERCAVLVVDVGDHEEIARLDAVRERMRQDLPVIAIAGRGLEGPLRARSHTVLTRPLHASLVIEAIRAAVAHG